MIRVLAKSHKDVSARLVPCPPNLSSKTSSIVRGNIVLVGKDLTKIRPAAAVGAAAIVLVKGVDLPQSIDVRHMAEDVKVPVVAVSESGQEQLKMGALATLLFSNGIGSFSPEDSQLIRPKQSASWRRQRDMMRSGGNATLASLTSLHTEELTVHSESDGSPAAKVRLLPVSQMKQESLSHTTSVRDPNSPAYSRNDSKSPNSHRKLGEMAASSSNEVLEKSIMEQAEEQTQAVITGGDLRPRPRSRTSVEALVDFEIKESFEVLDSPLRDATLASMFGMTTPADIAEENEAHNAQVSPLPGPSCTHSHQMLDLGPMVTADVVCVTPGLSVTNVYRTPVAHRAPGSRHLADVGDENIDPQIEERQSTAPQYTNVLSQSTGLERSRVNGDQDGTMARDKQQAFFDLDPASMAGFLARLGITKRDTDGKSIPAVETHEEILDAVYSGMLSRFDSDTLQQRHDAVVRFREFCRCPNTTISTSSTVSSAQHARKTRLHANAVTLR